MRRGAYGYDAPYALVIFGLLSIASALIATMFWRQGTNRAAMQMTFYFVFFLGTPPASCTRPDAASFWSGTAFWIACAFAATSGCSTWGAAGARC